MNKVGIESFTFAGKEAGTSVLVFGAIHGDEQCGPSAIGKVMRMIESGELILQKGTVRFVPICNPHAYAEHSRVHKENLNRIFKKTAEPQNYEEELANELCELVDAHDVLLDIHSSFVPAPSNVFIDYPTPENVAFANALQAEFQVFDWPAVYAQNEFSFPSWTTDRYAHEAGKIGLLVECGKHDDPQSETLAVEYILRTLSHFGLMLLPETLQGTPTTPTAVYMNRIFQRESEGDTFSHIWSHLQRVEAGTKIATRVSGEQIIVDTDAYILFPKEYALPGGEWFYLGSGTAVTK